MFFINISFRYFSSVDNIKCRQHAKDALTVEMKKIEMSLKMTPSVAETMVENPKKTTLMEVWQQVVGGSNREVSVKGLFEEILQEHIEEQGAGTNRAGYLLKIIWYSSDIDTLSFDAGF